jgi:hypothetical protein
MIYIRSSSSEYYQIEGRRSKNEISQFISSGYLKQNKKSMNEIKNFILASHMTSISDLEKENKNRVQSAIKIERKVFELSDSNFESSTTTGIWLVLFYSSSPSICPDCYSTKREFASLALESRGKYFFIFYFFIFYFLFFFLKKKDSTLLLKLI